MIVTPLNPIEFFPLPVALAHTAATDLDLTDAALQYTFNNEDKNGVVIQPKKYYHKIVFDASYNTVFLIDDSGHTYTVEVFDSYGNYIDSFSLVLSGTAYVVGTINIATLGDATLSGTKLVMALVDTTDNLVLAITDLVNVVAAQPSRHVVITYQNARAYASSPAAQSFSLLVPAAFVRPNWPEDTESNTYADGTPVLLSSSVSTQRLLKVLPVPGYIHRKLKIALKCSAITIGGNSWVQTEAYNIEWQNEDFEFAWGRVFLTQSDGTNRNVLANE